MFRQSSVALVRLPKVRRPRERAWEIFNTRDFGFSEGSQNYSMWALMSLLVTVAFSFEGYQYWLRIMGRGDNCPACDAARKHYQQRLQNREFEMNEVLRRGKVD